MKRIVFLTAIMFVLAFAVNAQNDTLYILKKGIVIDKFNIDNEIDSIIFYKPTIISGKFTDTRDSTVYKWIKIGNQIWMAENLKYLPSVSDPGISSSSEPVYYVYDYKGSDVSEAKATLNYTTYGVLYNWPAAMNGQASSTANPSGVQGICPLGWHFPSNDEWGELINYLGGNTSDVGGMLKETGVDHWKTPNRGAGNETGFTALPGGGRRGNGKFLGITSDGYWWIATEHNSTDALFHSMDYSSSYLGKTNTTKVVGFSVRYVKD